MELTPLNTSIILVAGAVLSRIIDIITFLKNLKELFKKSNNVKECYKIESSNLNRTSNPRFRFSYIEPRTWDRLDPDNGDGSKYMHPTKSNISFSVSGMHDVLEDGDVSNTIKRQVESLSKQRGFKLLLSRPSGSYYYDFPDENTIETQKIRAWRLKYNLLDRSSGKLLTIFEYRCNFDGVCFTIHCQVPRKEFDIYEEFFLLIISEFRVLGIKSASFAQSK
jgi:hypothetical protein